MPYWSGASGRTAIESSPRSIGDVSPLWYGTTNDGSLTLLGSASNLQAVVAATRAAGLPLIPGIFDSTGAGVMSGILGDPVTRAAHVKNIVDGKLARVLTWYDNEWGFATRMADTALVMSKLI